MRGSPVSSATSATMEASATESTTVETSSSMESFSSVESPAPISAAKAGHGMIVEAVSNRRRTRSVKVVIAADTAVVRRVPHH